MPPVPVHSVPARSGVALQLQRGQTIKVINTHGKQVIDLWVLNANDPYETLSMPHTHGALSKLTPAVGDTLSSNISQPMVLFTADTTKGVHDTLISACDAGRYRLLGAEGFHPSCADNYTTALRRSKLVSEDVLKAGPPSPLNLFMNVQVAGNGELNIEAPTSEAGQYVCLQMLMDAVLVMSACPMDLRPTNNFHPTDCQYTIN